MRGQNPLTIKIVLCPISQEIESKYNSFTVKWEGKIPAVTTFIFFLSKSIRWDKKGTLY